MRKASYFVIACMILPITFYKKCWSLVNSFKEPQILLYTNEYLSCVLGHVPAPPPPRAAVPPAGRGEEAPTAAPSPSLQPILQPCSGLTSEGQVVF